MMLTDYIKLCNSGDKLRSNVCPERRTDILLDHLGCAYRYRFDVTENPRGESEKSLGTIPGRLLEVLKTAFEGKHPDKRTLWQSNPCKMSDEDIRLLSSITIVVAKLEILYKS